jgi:hypothetical protein
VSLHLYFSLCADPSLPVTSREPSYLLRTLFIRFAPTSYPRLCVSYSPITCRACCGWAHGRATRAYIDQRELSGPSESVYATRHLQWRTLYFQTEVSPYYWPSVVTWCLISGLFAKATQGFSVAPRRRGSEATLRGVTIWACRFTHPTEGLVIITSTIVSIGSEFSHRS